MEVKELVEFMEWTTGLGRYNRESELTKKEEIFAQTVKIGEEYGELCEQILGNLGAERKEKADCFSQEHLEDELADVIYTTIRLACLMEIDIEKALENKKEKLLSRMKG